MTIHQQLDQALHNIQPAGAPDGSLVTLSVPSGEWHLQVIQSDSLACSLQSITWKTPITQDWSWTQHRQLAENLAARLHYLLEPIALVEGEPSTSTLQLRSAPPHQSDQERCYYELICKPGIVDLRRFRKQAGSVRQSAVMMMTREVITRIISDTSTAVEAGGSPK